MFYKDIKTEAIPERVLEMTRIAAEKKSIDRSELKDIFIQEKLSKGVTDYFGPVFEAAQELEIIQFKDNQVVFSGEKNDIKSFNTFRRYCNSRLFDDENSQFYQIISCFLDANDDWFQYGSISTSDEIPRILNKKTGIPTMKLKKDVVLAIRFWINFLGFGYIQESAKIFLPNMYTSLKDFIVLGNIESGKEYSMREFFDNLHRGSSVALNGSRESLRINLALSNALRLLHDNSEIQLQNNLDSAEVWHLFKNEEHVFTSEVTHIIVREVK